MAAEGDDFVVRNSGRKRKASLKQTLLEESEDSDDDFISPSKRGKPKAEKGKGPSAASNQPQVSVASNQKPKRLSREEKMFNRALEQALVVSTSSSPEGPQSDKQSSTEQNNLSDHTDTPDHTDDVPDHTDQSDTSDFAPDDHPTSSESDDDFQPSPSPEKVVKKKREQKKEPKVAINKTKPSVKKENMRNSSNKNKPTPAARKTVKPVGVKDADLPGNKPQPSAGACKGRGLKPRWVPPSRTSVSGTGVASSPHTRTASSTAGIRVGLSRRAPVKPLHQTPITKH